LIEKLTSGLLPENREGHTARKRFDWSTQDSRDLPSPWLTAAEAAAYCRLNIEVFRRMVRKGHGPASYGKSRLRRFLLRDVDAWIRAGMGGESP
jgi:hypothetical protein